MRGAARLLRRDDLVERFLVPAREERRPVEHDVDLVGAVRDRAPDLGEPQVERRQPRRERARHARDAARRCPATASAATPTSVG